MYNHFIIIYEDNDVFFVTHRDVLRQTGITDCGLFALGFLFGPIFVNYIKKIKISILKEKIMLKSF